MPIASGSAPLQNPRSAAQWRAYIASQRNSNEGLEADVLTLQTEMLVVQGQVDPVSAEFDTTMGVGEPVRIVSTGNAEQAQGDSATNSDVAGLAFTAAAATETGAYVPEGGRVTQANWTAVIGSASLTPGTVYYVDPSTAGDLTATKPTTSGEVVKKVGRALTATTMQVELGPSVLL